MFFFCIFALFYVKFVVMKLHSLEQVIDALGGQGLDRINITLPRVSHTQFNETNPFDFALEERDEIVVHGYYTFNDVEGILDYQCEGYGDVAKNVRKELHLLIMQLLFIMKCRPCVLQSVANETFCYLIDCYFAMKMYEDKGHCHEVAELIEGFANDIYLLFCPHISVDGGVMLLWERNGFRLESDFLGRMFEQYEREGESDGLYMTYYPFYCELLDERQPRIVEIRRGVMRYIMEQMLPKLTDEVFRNHIYAQLKEVEKQMFDEGYVEEIPDGNDKGEEVVGNEVCAGSVAKGDELVRELVESRVIGEDDGEVLKGWLRVLICEGKVADGVCAIRTKTKLLLSYTLYRLKLYIHGHTHAGNDVWYPFIKKVANTGSKPNKRPDAKKHQPFVAKIKRLTSEGKE